MAATKLLKKLVSSMIKKKKKGKSYSDQVKPKSKSKTPKPKGSSNNVKDARKEKGKNATFSYKGKMYSTATMDDVKKAGFDNLKDYLNSMKKK